jgi:hypothetical protein
MTNKEILKGISKIITADSPNKRKMAELVNGNSLENKKNLYIGAEINDTDRHITFNNEFIQDFGIMKKLGEILNYAHNRGYTTNLDKKE